MASGVSPCTNSADATSARQQTRPAPYPPAYARFMVLLRPHPTAVSSTKFGQRAARTARHCPRAKSVIIPSVGCDPSLCGPGWRLAMYQFYFFEFLMLLQLAMGCWRTVARIVTVPVTMMLPSRRGATGRTPQVSVHCCALCTLKLAYKTTRGFCMLFKVTTRGREKTQTAVAAAAAGRRHKAVGAACMAANMITVWWTMSVARIMKPYRRPTNGLTRGSIDATYATAVRTFRSLRP